MRLNLSTDCDTKERNVGIFSLVRFVRLERLSQCRDIMRTRYRLYRASGYTRTAALWYATFGQFVGVHA